MKKIKILLIHNIIYPPRVPLFNMLARNKKIELSSFFLTSSMKGRLLASEDVREIKFNYKILPDYRLAFKGQDFFQYIFNPTIFQELSNYNPDVIISFGWAYPANLAALIFAKKNHKKFILFSESTIKEKSWRRSFATPLVKLFIKWSNAFIAPGTASKEYLEKLGAPRRRIFIAPNAIDNEFFEKNSQISKGEKQKLKKTYGIKEEKKVILFAGRLEGVKGLDFLLEAFRKIRSEKSNVALLLVGEGPEEKKLKEKCLAERMKDVYFTGSIKRRFLPKIYGISDLLVLPSVSEVWGFVLNEAMASRLPVIASRNVGGARDLIKNGFNGYSVEAGNTRDLYLAIKKTLFDKRFQKMGKNSKAIVQNFTYQKMVDAFMKAINFVLR